MSLFLLSMVIVLRRHVVGMYIQHCHLIEDVCLLVIFAASTPPSAAVNKHGRTPVIFITFT